MKNQSKNKLEKYKLAKINVIKGDNDCLGLVKDIGEFSEKDELKPQLEE